MPNSKLETAARNANIARKPIATAAEKAPVAGLAGALRLPNSVAGAAKLQRSAGNRATGAAIQRKLKVGSSADPHERDADAVASAVLNHSVAAPSAGAARAAFDAGPDVQRALAQNAGKGSRLNSGMQRKAEAAIGASLDGVRVHEDSDAAQLSRALNAQAFTHGNDVYLGEGVNQGNEHIMAHELAHVQQQTGGVAAGIQRYPATVLESDAGVSWQAQTKTAKKSGEGVSGGVYFLTSDAGPKKNVVIKPEFVESVDGQGEAIKDSKLAGSQANAELSDQILGFAGFNAPKSRTITADSQEGQQLVQTITGKGAELPLMKGDPNGLEGATRLGLLRVMDTAQGSSVSSLAKDANSDDKTAKLFAQLSNSTTMKKIGHLFVVDAFMGNMDRVHAGWEGFANLGNIMVNGGQVTAIDSNMIIKQIGNDKDQMDLQDIANLFDKRDVLIGAFFRGIEHGLPEESRALFTSMMKLLGRGWTSNINAGIDQGIADLRTRLSAGGKAKKGLKKSMKSWESQDSKKQSGARNFDVRVDYERFREREKYLEMRGQGGDDKDARAGLDEYRRYRQARSQAKFGTKWMTKLKYKRGGFANEEG